MQRLTVAAVVVVLAQGCAPTQYRQSSLVPIPSLPTPPRMNSWVEVSGGDSTLAFVSPPTLAPNTNAGLWLSRVQLEGAVTVRPHRFRRVRWGLRLPWMVALPDGAVAASPTTLENPGLAARGFGTGASVRADFDSGVSFGFTVDLMGVSIPSRVRPVAYDGMPLGSAYDSIQRTNVAVFSGTFSLGMKVGRLVELFSVLGMRNQPTNLGSFSSYTGAAEVRSGPMNGVIGVGANVDVVRGLAVVPQIQWPFTGTPVMYGPIFSLALRVEIGRDDRPLSP